MSRPKDSCFDCYQRQCQTCEKIREIHTLKKIGYFGSAVAAAVPTVMTAFVLKFDPKILMASPKSGDIILLIMFSTFVGWICGFLFFEESDQCKKKLEELKGQKNHL